MTRSLALPLAPVAGPASYRLDAPAGDRRGAPHHEDETATPDRHRDGRLLCVQCASPITHEGARIARGGAHEHGRINPAGFSFHLACFSSAPGVTVLGGASSEHTWFPGYTWRIVLCGTCHHQMGWRFDGGEGDAFYGLIVSRLVPEEDRPSSR